MGKTQSTTNSLHFSRSHANEPPLRELFIERMYIDRSKQGPRMQQTLADFNSKNFALNFSENVRDRICNEKTFEGLSGYHKLFRGIVNKIADTKFTNNLMQFIYIYLGQTKIAKIGAIGQDNKQRE